MVRIEVDSLLTVLLRNELEAIVADEDRGSATLSRVRLHRLLNGEYGWGAITKSVITQIDDARKAR